LLAGAGTDDSGRLGLGYELPSELTPGQYAYVVTAADVDGDGALDLITGHELGNERGEVSGDDFVSVMRNLGDGTYGEPEIYLAGDDPTSIVANDIDGDGVVNLLIANRGDDTVSVMRNLGDGTFGAQEVYAVGDSPHSITVADVDADGWMDLVAANGTAGTLSVLRNVGDGKLAAAESHVVDDSYGMTAADVDNDGTVNLIAAEYGGSAM
jgi:hypothetical protein